MARRKARKGGRRRTGKGTTTLTDVALPAGVIWGTYQASGGQMPTTASGVLSVAKSALSQAPTRDGVVIFIAGKLLRKFAPGWGNKLSFRIGRQRVRLW